MAVPLVVTLAPGGVFAKEELRRAARVGEGRCQARSLPALVSAHQPGLGQDVAGDRVEHLLPGRARLEQERGVQRVKPEEITVRPARRRTRTAVPDAAKVIHPGLRAGGQRVRRGRHLGQVPGY